MNSCLYTATLRHRRSRPTVHDFRYRIFMFYFDLDELEEVERTTHPFSVNRFNVVSFYDCDHMDRRPGSTKQKVLRFLSQHGVEVDGGKIFLLTSCRILGYVFNPISLYYCHGPSGHLDAVVAEVRNTFGEQYLYVLNQPLSHDGDPIDPRRYRTPKAMHVSPFISMDAVYEFHLAAVGESLAVGIVEHEAGTHVLDAQLWGHRTSLTTATLSRILLTYPLMTLRTTAAIHWQALRLYLKGTPFHRHPSPSAAQRAQGNILGGLRRP